MADQTPDDVLLKAARAQAAIGELCEGTRRWAMSVPAREDDDPDLVLSSAIHGLVEALKAERATAAAREQALYAEVARLKDELAAVEQLDTAIVEVTLAEGRRDGFKSGLEDAFGEGAYTEDEMESKIAAFLSSRATQGQEGQ